MSYKGAWRNRLRNLYVQYCYVDELPVQDPKLLRGLELHGIMFDDEWGYEIAKRKDPNSRQVVVRYPIWWGKDEHKLVEKGDFDPIVPDVRQKILVKD